MPNTEKRGMTLIELIVCTVIIGILSATALPLSRNYIQREKEEALKEHLRTMREGIDRYRDRMRQKNPKASEADCYPQRLEDLVDERILRRIPADPMTQKPDWRTRSTTDSPETAISDGKNVFDVFSTATGTAFNGTPYSMW